MGFLTFFICSYWVLLNLLLYPFFTDYWPRRVVVCMIHMLFTQPTLSQECSCVYLICRQRKHFVEHSFSQYSPRQWLCMWVHAFTWKCRVQKWKFIVFLYYSHLTSWDKVSQWTWSLLIWLTSTSSPHDFCRLSFSH